MNAPTDASRASDLVTRFQRVVSAIHLDCDSAVTLKRALARFAALEHTREVRRALAVASEHRDQIIARIAFLAELDELNEHEADRSVFNEMATLFDEIAAAAAGAAAALCTIARSDQAAH